jgi:pimeloyl-ACP methyl ester carboxylesterase
VLHSLGGNDYQLESTVLWEYLAAHGYVVAVLPQLGPSLEDGTLAFSPEDLALQSEDLEFALEVLSEAGVADGPLPSLETDRIGVVGHSSGGIAALLLAGRSRRVAAIAGLDPSFTTGEGAALLDRMSFDYASVTAALLDLRANANGILDLDPLNAMRHADRYDAAIGGERPPRKATHFDFQNWPLYGVLTGVEDDRGASARPAAQGRAVYLAVCRLTRAFFDVVLRGRRDAAGYLTGDTPLPPPDPTIAFGRYPAEP